MVPWRCGHCAPFPLRRGPRIARLNPKPTSIYTLRCRRNKPLDSKTFAMNSESPAKAGVSSDSVPKPGQDRSQNPTPGPPCPTPVPYISHPLKKTQNLELFWGKSSNPAKGRKPSPGSLDLLGEVWGEDVKEDCLDRTWIVCTKYRTATYLKVTPRMAISLIRTGAVPPMSYQKAARICLLGLLSGSPLLKWTCNHCDRESDNPSFFDVDHVLAMSKNGSSDISNLEILCPSCHREKSLREGDMAKPPRRPRRKKANP